MKRRVSSDHPRPGVRPGPHFFVNFRHFQLFDCDQHNLSSYAMIVLHLLPFYSRNKFWIVWQRLRFQKNWNWISLLVAIIACMDCLPFLDFLFLVLLLNFSPLCTSWQTSLLLNECGAPSALCVMPVGKTLRLPMHLISIEHAHIWSAHRASCSMMDPLEQT